jgi:transcriptional regulator with XRE-family HTH domain
MAVSPAIAQDSQPRRMPPSALRLRRLALGLRQEDVACAVGMTRQWVAILEAGRAVPSWPTAHAIADYLGSDPRELFPTPQNKPRPRVNRAAATVQMDSGHRHATG